MTFNDVVRYFDLQSAKRTLTAKAQGVSGGTPPVPKWWPQYLALVAGIVVQPYLNYYVQHGAWSLDLSSVIGRIVFGAFIAVLAFPAVYKNAFDPDKPYAVQLCAIFASGIGWQSVIQGGARAALGLT